MPLNDLLKGINNEDKTVPYAVEKVIPQIEKLVLITAQKIKQADDYFISAQEQAADWGFLMHLNARPPMECLLIG